MPEQPPSYHYAQARLHAGRVARAMRRSTLDTSPPTEVGTVADTSFLLEQGYVLATTHRGPVRVQWDPTLPVAKGMKIYVRQLQQQGPPRFISDGYAPRVSGYATGGAAALSGQGGGAALPSGGGLNTTFGASYSGVPSVTLPSQSYSAGWYWSGFVALSALPAHGTSCVLFEQAHLSSGTVIGGLQLVCDWLGHWTLQSYGTWGGSGTASGPTGAKTSLGTTSRPFAPHAVWYFTLVAGLGLAIDGAHNTPDMTMSGLEAGFTMPAGQYSLFLLSDSLGANAAPVGSWLSKPSFGHTMSGGVPLWPSPVVANPASTAGLFVPENDSQLPNGGTSLGSGLNTFNLYRLSDASSRLAPDTGLARTATNALYLADTLLTTGPY